MNRYVDGPAGAAVAQAGFATHALTYRSVARGLDDHVERVAQLVDSLGAKRVHFVAHSMGGLVTAAYLARARPGIARPRGAARFTARRLPCRARTRRAPRLAHRAGRERRDVAQASRPRAAGRRRRRRDRRHRADRARTLLRQAAGRQRRRGAGGGDPHGRPRRPYRAAGEPQRDAVSTPGWRARPYTSSAMAAFQLPARTIAVALAALALGGCATVEYYSQAVFGHFEVMRRSRPIDDVIADPASPAAVKARLERVREIRAFAVHASSGCPTTAPIRGYADLGRPVRRLERLRRAAALDRAGAVVLPGRRLRDLPRLLRAGRRAGACRAAARPRASIRTSAACRRTRRSAGSTIRCSTPSSTTRTRNSRGWCSTSSRTRWST